MQLVETLKIARNFAPPFSSSRTPEEAKAGSVLFISAPESLKSLISVMRGYAVSVPETVYHDSGTVR